MPNKKWVAGYEGIFGLVGLGALFTENVVRYLRGDYDPADLWSYFTYQSNLIAAVALLASTYSIWKGANWKHLDFLRGAATLYMIVTGLVYSVLVNNADPAVMIDHYIMHYLMPVVMIVGWVLHQPALRISYRWSLLWLAYPLVYAGFVQVHGALTGDYFYEFLSPVTGGYTPVLITIGVLILFAAFVAFLLTRLPRKRKQEICTDIMGHGNLYGDHFVCATCSGRIPDVRTAD
jgi:hypothetical protein